MANQMVVSREEWLVARREHLAKEKEFTKLRDQLSQQRRELPWVKVDKEYVFEGPNGKETLAELFAGRSQLLVYHFMFGSDWEEGCPSCSFWADNFNGINVHLNHRDVTMISVSTAPLDVLNAYKRRMGWDFKWVSASQTDFSRDYNVSFSADEVEKGETEYNFGTRKAFGTESPGISVFYKDENGDVFHIYSCYARGLDMMNGAYHYLDLVPKWRDEAELQFPMARLRRHDKYDD